MISRRAEFLSYPPVPYVYLVGATAGARGIAHSETGATIASGADAIAVLRAARNHRRGDSGVSWTIRGTPQNIEGDDASAVVVRAGVSPVSRDAPWGVRRLTREDLTVRLDPPSAWALVRDRVLAYMDVGIACRTLRSLAACSHCPDGRGETDAHYTDGTVYWHSSVAHDIRRHAAVPPTWFVEHVLGEITS